MVADAMLDIHAAKVELELETRGFDHIAKIADSLGDVGYKSELKLNFKKF